MILWSFLLAAIGIAGVYLAGKQNYWGWGLGVIAQVLWAVYAVTTGQWGFLVTCFAYAYIYGKNFFAWSPGIKVKLGRREQIQRGGIGSTNIQVGGDFKPVHGYATGGYVNAHPPLESPASYTVPPNYVINITGTDNTKDLQERIRTELEKISEAKK
jgi:hypothetical protein